MKILASLDRSARATFELQGHSKGWLQSIEGLRGIAAFMVFMVHYATLVEPWVPDESLTDVVGEAVFIIGHVGVDVIFAISGFLIYAMLIRKERPVLPYTKRRVARIYPTFLAVMLIYTVLSFVFPEESKIPAGEGEAAWYLFANYLLLPGVLDIEPMIAVAWSLSYEMFFYLIMPVLFLVFPLRKCAAWVRISFWGLFWVGGFIAVPGHFRASMFIVGFMVYETSQMIDRERGSAALTLSTLTAFAAVLAFKVSIYFDLVTFKNAGIVSRVMLFGACYLLCIAAFCKDGWLSRFFSQRYMRYFGNISYSFYLIHGLTLKAIFLVLAVILPSTDYAGFLWFWLLFLPAFLAATAVSTLLFLLVERPFSLDGVSLFRLVRSRSATAS